MKSGALWALIVFVVSAAAVAAWLYATGALDHSPLCKKCAFLQTHHHHGKHIHNDVKVNELKGIALGQNAFRDHDRDGDGVKAFWRKDVAGLYALQHSGDSADIPIYCIDPQVAAADDNPVVTFPSHPPVTLQPHCGYWYRAIRHLDEKELQEDRFAVCAFPAKYAEDGAYCTYVIDERAKVWRRDFGHSKGIWVFPSDEELASKWIKMH